MIISGSIHVAADGNISFLWLSSIPLYVCTTSSLSTHLLTDIYVVSTSWLLWCQCQVKSLVWIGRGSLLPSRDITPIWPPLHSKRTRATYFYWAGPGPSNEPWLVVPSVLGDEEGIRAVASVPSVPSPSGARGKSALGWPCRLDKPFPALKQGEGTRKPPTSLQAHPVPFQGTGSRLT